MGDGQQVGKTDDGADPPIPRTLAVPLRRELEDATRAVADGSEPAAEWQGRLDDARLALGRHRAAAASPDAGASFDDSPLAHRLAATVRALLRQRAPDSSICPSEAARVVGGEDWRTLMPLVREVAWSLEAAGCLQITRGGERLPEPSPGPLRLKNAAGSTIRRS